MNVKKLISEMMNFPPERDAIECIVEIMLSEMDLLCPHCKKPIRMETKKCPKCGGRKIRIFDADEDQCEDCLVTFPGA